MSTMDLIEPQYLALCVFAGFVGLSILLYAIASFGMRETTYEEAIAEQRARIQKENQEQHELKQQRKQKFASSRRRKEKEKPQGKSPKPGSTKEVTEEERGFSEEEAPPTPPQNVTPRQEKPKKKEKVTPEKPPSQEKPKPVEAEIIKPSRSKRTESAPLPPPPVVEEVIQKAVEEPVLAQQEVQVEAAPPAPKHQQEHHTPGKSKKTKTAGPSGDTPDAPMKGKALVNAVKAAQLKPGEIQQIMEILLAKQGGGSADDWVMANQRTDPSSALKKQLQEKEQALHNEMLLSQSNMEKAKELRAELAQEKSRSKDLEHQFKNKLDMQNQELDALRRRMQQTHDQHSLETQGLQTRLKQMQSLVDESNIEVVKQLREENSRMKSDTSLAQQQKEQIMGAEMARLQGELQNMQSKVTASEKQMRQVDDMRNDFQARISGYEVTINKMEASQREKEMTLSTTLAKKSEELQRAEAQKQSLTAEVERSKEILRKSSEDLENAKKRIADLSKSEEEKRKTIAKFEEKEKDAEYQRQGLETKVRAIESQFKESEKAKAEFTQQIEHLKQEKMNLENQIAVSIERSEGEGQEEPAKAATNGDINIKDMISIAEHETILSEKQQKLEKLEQDITARSNEIQKLTEQIEELTEQNEELTEEIEKQRKKNDNLREKNWKAMEALSAMEKSSEENLKKSLKQLQEELGGKLKQEQQQSKKVVQTIFPTIQVNESLAHEKWMKEFEQKAIELLKEKESSSDKSEDLNSKISSLEADCKKYSSNVESLEMEKAELSKNVAELQYEKKQLTAQCDHYQSVLGDTEGMLNKLQSSVELEEKKWEEKLASTEKLLQQAKAEVVSLQSELSSLKSKQQDTSDYHRVVSELAASKSTIEQLEKDRQSVAGELEDVKKQLTHLKDELEAANQRAESNNAGPEIEQLKQNVADATSEKEKLAADLNTASTTISELQNKLDAAPKADVDALQKELEATKDALQQAKTQSSTQLQALEKELQDTKLALKQAETAVTEANNNSQKSVELQKELQAAKAEVEKAQGEVQRLSGELEKAKSQSSSQSSEELESKDKQIATLNATVTEERRLKKELAIATGRLQQMLKKTQALLETEKKTSNSLRVELGKEPAAEVNSSLTDSQMEEELEAALQESIKLAKEAGVDEASGGGTSV
ncbi:Ribosome-binding protein 1 [Holothuria leucospilota]|uniref:Ribosome-binding protein 1 n=1 Tax=Holothuria leucospilota TaxID=206669 RepID=A0A9Q1CHX6_HOLLE|nr:Ribosome-binding protein 1 [Holothuria leucospilota]